MGKIGIFLSIAVLIILYSNPVLTTEGRMSLTDKEILGQLHTLDMRIVRLEGEQKNLLARMDGLVNIILGGFCGYLFTYRVCHLGQEDSYLSGGKEGQGA